MEHEFHGCVSCLRGRNEYTLRQADDLLFHYSSRFSVSPLHRLCKSVDSGFDEHTKEFHLTKLLQSNIWKLVKSLEVRSFVVVEELAPLFLLLSLHNLSISVVQNLCQTLQIMKASLGSPFYAHLRELSILYVEMSNDDCKLFSEFLSKTRTLRHLHLRGCSINDEKTEIMKNGFSTNTSLVRIYLHQNLIGPKGAAIIARILLLGNSKWRTLHLGENSLLDKGVIALSSGLGGFCPLRILNLQGNGFGPEGARAIALALQRNKSLRRLNFGSNAIGSKGVAHISKMLEINETLRELKLDGVQMKTKGAIVLFTALKKNKGIRKIKISNNSIESNAADAIVECCNHNGSLVTMNLNQNELGVDGAESIGRIIGEKSRLVDVQLACMRQFHIIVVFPLLHEHLKVLYMTHDLWLLGNLIGPEGVKHVAQLFRAMFCLTSLNLNFNGIRDEGAIIIADALRVQKTISTLHLSRNEISDVGAISLAESLIKRKIPVELDLQINDISARGIAVIAEAVEQNVIVSLNLEFNLAKDEAAIEIASAMTTTNALRDIYLSYNDITDEGAIALCEAFESNPRIIALVIDDQLIEDFSISERIDRQLERRGHQMC
eukprot:TRINITY_DN13782_c0_g1_i13.p1 TRINITY_DN13782_c0_g1~~TRINITY_DN13782_c0_g1_i13.p1  ORF type:complete len:625 (-),score=123.94 TRINITY_DN13782_c0_g1_i13:641-2458(-)